MSKSQRSVEDRIVPNGAAIHDGEVRQLMYNFVTKTLEDTGEKPSTDALMERYGRSASFCRKVRGGELEPKAHGGGVERTLKVHHLAYLRTYMLEHPFLKQPVYAAALLVRFPGEFKTVPIATAHISRAIKGMGLSYQSRRQICGLIHDGDIFYYASRFPFLAYDYGDNLAWFDATGISRETGR